MALTWKLSEIRAEVRELASLPDTSQMSDNALNDKINDFYLNILPGDLYVQELESWYTFDTAVDDDCEKSLLATVRTIEEPMTLKDSDDNISKVRFYLNKNTFFEFYPEDSTDEDAERGRPVAALLYNRTVYLRPKADEIFTFKAASKIKPTALETGDVPLDVRWGPAIAQGTAVLIKQRAKAWELAKELSVVYDAMIRSINGRDLVQKTRNTRAMPRW